MIIQNKSLKRKLKYFSTALRLKLELMVPKLLNILH